MYRKYKMAAASGDEIYNISFVKTGTNVFLRKIENRTNDEGGLAAIKLIGTIEDITGTGTGPITPNPRTNDEIKAAIDLVKSEHAAAPLGWGGKRRTKHARYSKRKGKSRKHRSSRK
jgi:hypothetical protein